MKKNIAKYQKVAFAFAKKYGYDRCVFEKEWNGYMAFYVSSKASKGACTGYPQFALVDDEMNVCFSDINDLENGLFFEKSDGSPPVDLSSPEALDAWLEKYGDNG